MPWSREDMAERAAQELRDGYYVNLGIGIPTLVANYIPAGMKVVLQSENGMLGMGPFPYEGEEDAGPDQRRQADHHRSCRCSSYFSSADSFGMIRGGHIDLSVLGRDGSRARTAISPTGWCPARWSRAWAGPWIWWPACKRVVVVMEHISKDGSPKFKPRCELPLTGANVVDMLITDLAVFSRANRQAPFQLVDMAPGVTLAEISAKTTAKFLPPP